MKIKNKQYKEIKMSSLLTKSLILFLITATLNYPEFTFAANTEEKDPCEKSDAPASCYYVVHNEEGDNLASDLDNFEMLLRADKEFENEISSKALTSKQFDISQCLKG